VTVLLVDGRYTGTTFAASVKYSSHLEQAVECFKKNPFDLTQERQVKVNPFVLSLSKDERIYF